ncbi:MAG TPA: hypothetical protein VGR55_14235 [Candidatus Acidoferrum sp.]|nr:hypothetical protein [Candidatus Acidoferrum sp.]
MNLIRTLLRAALKPQIANSCIAPFLNAATGRRARLLLTMVGIVFSSLCNLQPADAQIIHISYSPLDQWVQCASNVLGKPLVLNIVDYRFPCPRNLDELNAQLSGKGLVVQGEKWDLILGKGYTTPFETPPEFWRDAEVGVHFGAWPRKIEGSRQPTEAELRELSESALRAIRPGVWIVPPIAPKREQGTEQPTDHIAKFGLEFFFDIHQLFPNGPESVIGILRSTEAVLSERLIYGEYRNGKPVFLWDSPLLAGFGAGLEYYSVRNDQVEDIVIKGVPYCGNRSCASSLVVFRKDGWELTRQMADDCRDGSTCPIKGGDFKFVRQSNPLSGVPDRIEVHWTESGQQPDDVYLLGSSNLFEKQPHRAPTKKN